MAKAGPPKVEKRAARCIRCSGIAVAPIGSPQLPRPIAIDERAAALLTAWLGFADSLRAP